MRRPVAAISVVILLGSAVAIVASETWHGPTVMSISAGHGIDTGDLLAFPLVVLAIAVWRRGMPDVELEARPPSRAAAAAVVLGALLLLAGVSAKEGAGPSCRPAVGRSMARSCMRAIGRRFRSVAGRTWR